MVICHRNNLWNANIPYQDLMDNECITWKIGVKIHDIQMTANFDQLDINRIMEDRDMFNTQMVEIMNNENVTKGWLVQFCQSLYDEFYQRNAQLEKENLELR
eukprot:1123545_1